jgi:hypothetical protein
LSPGLNPLFFRTDLFAFFFGFPLGFFLVVATTIDDGAIDGTSDLTGFLWSKFAATCLTFFRTESVF